MFKGYDNRFLFYCLEIKSWLGTGLSSPQNKYKLLVLS